MKSELFTAIGVAIAGVIISIIVTNIIVDNFHPIEEVRVKSIDGVVNTDFVEPNPLVFNYRAINPTVEVYVGDSDKTTPECADTDSEGNCIYLIPSDEENQ